MQKRHLLITYDFPPLSGGIARWMSELTKRYAHQRLLVSTPLNLHLPIQDHVLEQKVKRVAISKKNLKNPLGIWRWSRAVKKLAKQHLIQFTWCGNYRPAAYPAYKLLRKYNTPYGIIFHGDDVLTLQKKIKKSFLKKLTAKKLLGNAAVIVTNSEWTRTIMLDVIQTLKLNIAAEKIICVKLGTDPKIFHPNINTNIVRERFKIDVAKQWLLSVARLEPYKGMDYTLTALAQLKDQYPNLHYAIAGKGRDEQRLKALAKSLEVEDRVRWLGFIDDESLPALYNCADIYVGASRADGIEIEGFGISLVEASSCGVPVVAGDCGGMKDAVQHNVTGLLVDTTSPEAIADGIKKILDNPQLANELGNNGRKAVENFYNWDRVAKDLSEIANLHCHCEER